MKDIIAVWQWRNYKFGPPPPAKGCKTWSYGPLPVIEQFELHENRSLIESNVNGYSRVNGGLITFVSSYEYNHYQ